MSIHAFCFAQDVLGVQFAIVDNHQVVSLDPETAERTVLGESLDDWARWLLSDPDINATYRIATAWQDENAPWSMTRD